MSQKLNLPSNVEHILDFFVCCAYLEKRINPKKYRRLREKYVTLRREYFPIAKKAARNLFDFLVDSPSENLELPPEQRIVLPYWPAKKNEDDTPDVYALLERETS